MNRIFVCPKCKGTLSKTGNSFVCDKNHTFDISKHGYVNLHLSSSGVSGDDKEMCRSRHMFHSGDYYKCLSEKLADLCIKYNVDSVLDAGCGEGYYLRKIRDCYNSCGKNLPILSGVDIAKEAISIASRAEKQLHDEYRINYAVAGIFALPVADGSIDSVLSVFAPVASAESGRVLNSGGILIVVSPGAKHLDGLKASLYQNVYDNEVTDTEYEGFELAEKVFVEDTICVTGDNIKNLFHMTPYYWKTSPEDADKLSNIDELTTKIEFIIRIYKKI